MNKPANHNAKTPPAATGGQIGTTPANAATRPPPSGGGGIDATATATSPKSWGDIQVGSLVIAQEGLNEGWWEAVVTEMRGDILTLRWRDYPKLPTLIRDRKAVALLFSGG